MNLPQDADAQQPRSNSRVREWCSRNVAGAWLWYWRNFLGGFCYYFPLLLLLLFPLGLLLGWFGDRFGTRFLFLHDDPLKQIFAGISLALFLIAVFFVGYLLWLRDLRHGRLEPSFEDWFQKHSGGTTPRPGPQLSYRGYFLALVVSVLATVVVFWLILEVGGPLLRVLGPEDASSPEAGEDEHRAYVYLSLGVAGTLFILGFVGRHLGSLGDWLLRRFTPKANQTNVPKAWKILGRSSGFLVLAGWIIAAWLLRFQGDFSFGIKGWTLVLTIFGFLATLATLLWGGWSNDADVDGDPSAAETTLATLLWGGWSKPVPQWLFFLTFFLTCFANLVLVYAFVSWAVSMSPLGLPVGLLLGGLCLVILLLALSVFCPGPWCSLREGLRQSLDHLWDEERAYLALGLGGVLFIAPFLLLVTLCPALVSPIPLFMFLLFLVVVGYGVTAYFVRRKVILILILVVLLAFVSHIQRYGMRFEGLNFYSDGKLVYLRSEVNEAHDRQQTFDRQLEEYLKKKDELDGTAAELKRQTDTMDNTTVKDKKTDLAREVGNLEERKGRLEDECQRLMDRLKSSWEEMEAKNKVLAARFPIRRQRDYSDLARHFQEAGEHPKRLLKTRQLKHTLGKGDKPEPLILITVSGGGSRAAVWTFLVLKRLELEFARADFDFPAHVRIITGASGGMLGAAYYVSTLPPPDQRPPKAPRFWVEREEALRHQQERLGADFLTPLMRHLVFNDVPAWLSPWPSRMDRGRGLEEAWNRHLLKPPFTSERTDKPEALEMTFSDLRQGEMDGWRPSLVFAPMMIEDGRRLIISNLDLRSVVSNDGVVLPPAVERSEKYADLTDNHSIEGLELFRLFPDALKTMKLSTAVRMSASFPYFTPAISLPTVPRRRVVDAGYYDNYGVSLAASWLFSETNQEWIKKQSGRRILLIQIRDGITEPRRQLLDPNPDNSTYRSRSLEELTSPPEGLYNSQDSSSSFRNDGQLELLFRMEELRDDLRRIQEEVYEALKRNQDSVNQALKEPQKAGEHLERLQEEQMTLLRSLEPQALAEDPVAKKRELKNPDPLSFPFVVANFELDPTASLSWYLSKREKEKINNAEKALKNKIDTILEWFRYSGELSIEIPKK